MKKFKKASLVMAMCLSVMSVSAFAQSTSTPNLFNDKVEVNDVLTNDDNKKEIVFRVNPDGSFITIPLEDSEISTYANPPQCQHLSIVRYGNPTPIKESLNKSDSTYCYKKRDKYLARCEDCGKPGFTSYTEWTKYKHSYSLFGKECKECGYQK